MAVKKIVVMVLVLVLLMTSVFAATRVFTVQETEFVKITVAAVDPDQDRVSYSFSKPLDDKGEWQTAYGDAGEYIVDVAATDGESVSVEQVKLVVEPKNRAPVLTEKKITIAEGDLVDLKSVVVDPELDALEFSFNEPYNSQGTWTPNYEDQGSYVVKFNVSDGEYDVEMRLEVEVLNSNQPPQVTSLFAPVGVLKKKEGTTLSYFVEAHDDEKLVYLWKFDRKLISEKSVGDINFDYASSGKHTLELIIDDGEKSVLREWTINVEDVNRKPELDAIELSVNEGELVTLDLPEVDQDGDTLTYVFKDPFTSEGVWMTNFSDEGHYTFELEATDGQFKTLFNVVVDIANVDRMPELNLPESLSVREGASFEWEINTSDLDGDELTVTINGAPTGSVLSGNTLKWEPGFGEIKRRGGLFSDFLNVLRIEHSFMDHKIIPLNVEVCGRDLCTGGDVDLYVYNENQAPVFKPIMPITVKETDEIRLDVEAVDYDGDLVHYYFTEPLEKTTGNWKTEHGDAATYIVYVTATDGDKGTTVPVDLIVEKDNRKPELDVHKKVVVNEGMRFSFTVGTKDVDDSQVDLIIKDMPEGATFKDGRFEWTPQYNLAEKEDGWWNNFVSKLSYTNKIFNSEKEILSLTFAANDGVNEVEKQVDIVVKNVNRVPSLIDYSPKDGTRVIVGEPVVFTILGGDPDGDELQYTWDFGFRQGQVEGTNAVERTFVTPGKKKISVVISDGRDEVEFVWSVDVVARRENAHLFAEQRFDIYVVEN